MQRTALCRLFRPLNRTFTYPVRFCVCFLALCSGDLYAGAPAVDNWYVNNGDVTAPCPVDAIACEFTTVDNGFLMRKVIMPSTSKTRASDNYWQYLMTDPYATGTPGNDAFSPTGLSFSNESIIRTDNSGPEQIQKTMVAGSVMHPGDIEDRWSQVAYVTTPGYRVSFEEKMSQIDWSAGPDSPVVLFDSLHKAVGQRGTFGGVHEFNQILTQDIWQGPDMTQKFQYQVDNNPQYHTAGVGTPILPPGGSNGGDLTIGSTTGVPLPLVATYVGQSVANDTITPSLFSYTGFRSHLSHQRETTSNITELSSLKTANPLVFNFNRFFNNPSSTDPLFPSNVYSIAPNINTPAQAVTPTAWAVGPPVDIAVAALNDHAASQLSGGAGTGGPPIEMGGWTVENGDIKMGPCPPTVICGPVTVGPGFLQREILVIADGSIYFQLIVTDSGATGDTATAPQLSAAALSGERLTFAPVPNSRFVPPPPADPFVPGVLTFANETFIKQGGGNGVANRSQVLGTYQTGTAMYGGNQTTVGYNYMPADGIAQRAVINTGWAQGSGAAPVIEIKQILGFDDFSTSNGSNFLNFLIGADRFLGWRAGSQFDFTMAANGATDYTVVSIPTQYKATGLYMRKIDGGVQTSNHALTDPLLIPGGTNGGNIAWDAGDTIQALWWGDSYNFYSGVTKNGFTAYANLTTGERTSREQSLSIPYGFWGGTSNQLRGAVSPNNPATWVSPFDTPAPPSVSGDRIIWPGQPVW